jgi:solute carrier family 26 (sodium-independent sulfate anion transporter), member 11
MGLLRIGWIVDLISLPAVSAFITGSALTITFGQIPVMMGMRGISSRDSMFNMGINILKHLDRIRIDAAVGISCLAVLYAMKWACGVGAKRKPSKAKVFFFLSTLRTVIAILLFTLISYLVNRTHKKTPTFRILGFIPRGKFQLMDVLTRRSNDAQDSRSRLLLS